MERILFFLVCLGLCVNSQYWKQVWSDEFDGSSIDLTKWQFEVNCDGGGNNELQCYTIRATNAMVQNGKLVITAKQESYNGKSYTSARLNNANSASWLYGRFEMNAKLPNGKMLWPAFWMLPTDYKYGQWAASGEIDIMEMRGQVLDKVEGTLHFGGAYPNNVYQGSGPQSMGSDLSKGFHTYAVEWDKDQVRWYVDTNMYYSMSLDRNFWSGKGSNPYTANGQPFDQRFHIVINLAIGGGFFPSSQYGTLSTQDAAAWADPTLVIDYIRAYEWSTTPAPPVLPTSKAATPTSKAATAANPTIPVTNQPVVQMPTTEATNQIDPNIQNANGLDNQQVQSSTHKAMGMPIPVVAGVFGGIGVLLIVVIVLSVVWFRKRASRRDMVAATELAVPGGFTPVVIRKASESTIFVPVVGLSCQAKYLDGNFYPVTIESVHGAQCLVNYGPDYGNERAWMNSSDMKQ